MDPVHNWNLEKQSAYLYRAIALREPRNERKQLFEKLADEAEGQARIWVSKFKPGFEPPPYQPNLRVHAVILLVKVLGPRSMRSILSAMKVRGMSIYQSPVSFHAKPQHLSQVGNRHKNLSAGNWLRAAVFGANDGLVSNASLIAGIAGATSSSSAVLLTGLSGLAAGAFSMACGEYISVKSQREYFEKQIAVEKEELESYPDEEAAELALIFEARGLTKEDAEKTSKALIADPSKALDTLAREELGINPNDLGHPQIAAISSFLSFGVGAFIPLLPFLIFPTSAKLEISIAITEVALFSVGALISLFTARSAFWGGIRMVLLGTLAGGSTYLLGWFFGVQLS